MIELPAGSLFLPILEICRSFKSSAASLLRSFHVRAYLTAIILSNGFCWFIAHVINSRETTDLTILSYNVDFGNSMVGSASSVYLLPILGLAIAANNFILSVFIFKLNGITVHILLAAALISNLIAASGLGFVYFINFHW